MNQEKINRYVDNLGVNEQADLLKRTLGLLLNEDGEENTFVECDFIEKQIEEFDREYKL